MKNRKQRKTHSPQIVWHFARNLLSKTAKLTFSDGENNSQENPKRRTHKDNYILLVHTHTHTHTHSLTPVAVYNLIAFKFSSKSAHGRGHPKCGPKWLPEATLSESLGGDIQKRFFGGQRYPPRAWESGKSKNGFGGVRDIPRPGRTHPHTCTPHQKTKKETFVRYTNAVQKVARKRNVFP